MSITYDACLAAIFRTIRLLEYVRS